MLMQHIVVQQSTTFGLHRVSECFLSSPFSLLLAITFSIQPKMAPKIYYADRYYDWPKLDLLSLLFGKTS